MKSAVVGGSGFAPCRGLYKRQQEPTGPGKPRARPRVSVRRNVEGAGDAVDTQVLHLQ